MEKELREVTITDEEGNEVVVNVLKEFTHKEKDYVVLYEECDCEDDCDCEDEAEDDSEENEMEDDSEENETEIDSEDDFEDTEQCECDMNVFIMQVEKDAENNETYVEIEDSKLMDELVEIASKILYEK